MRNFIQTAAIAGLTLGLTAWTAEPPQSPETAPAPAPEPAAAAADRETRPLSRMSPRDQHHVRDRDGAPQICETRPNCYSVIDPKTGRPYGTPS